MWTSSEQREEWGRKGRMTKKKKNNPHFVGILAKSGLWSLGIRHLRSVWFSLEELSTQEPDSIWRNIAWHPIPTSYLNSLYLHVFIWKLGLLVLGELSWESNEFIYVKQLSNVFCHCYFACAAVILFHGEWGAGGTGRGSCSPLSSYHTFLQILSLCRLLDQG